MRKTTLLLLSALSVAAFFARPTEAQISVGATAPNFTKQELTTSGPAGAFISLYDYTDKDAVVLFILGYG